MSTHKITVSENDAKRLQELCSNGVVPDGYAGLSTEDAVWVVMLLDGVDEVEARYRVALARGEADADDVIEEG